MELVNVSVNSNGIRGGGDMEETRECIHRIIPNDTATWWVPSAIGGAIAIHTAAQLIGATPEPLEFRHPLVIDQCAFRHNYIYIAGVISIAQPSPVLVRGGALMAYATTVIITNTSWTNNLVSVTSIYAAIVVSAASMYVSTIWDGTGGGGGQSRNWTHPTSLTIRDTQFQSSHVVGHSAQTSECYGIDVALVYMNTAILHITVERVTFENARGSVRGFVKS